MSEIEKNITCSFCSSGRKQVNQMIEGPIYNNNNLYICDTCVDYLHQILHDNKDSPLVEIKDKILSPEEIKEYLDKYIVGQDAAKISISVAMYNHFKRINNNQQDTEIDKSNVLMIGSSGCGKTLLVKTIAKLFDLPYVIADATTLTEAGYVGQDAENLIDLLIQNAGGNLEKAQRGIIFLDEIDKKSRKSESSTVTRDVSGEGVQQALLKIIEGTIIKVTNVFDRMETADFDTKNILFICSGAFVGLSDIIKKSRDVSTIGIGATIKNLVKDDDIIKTVTSEDLIKYGLIPEFVGRCPIVVVFDDLDTESLVRILKEPKNSIVSQFKALFKIENVDLEFDDKYLNSIASECIKQKIGARGLRGIIEKVLQQTQFLLPRLAKEGVTKVAIDGQGLARYVYKTEKKKLVNNENN